MLPDQPIIEEHVKSVDFIANAMPWFKVSAVKIARRGLLTRAFGLSLRGNPRVCGFACAV